MPRQDCELLPEDLEKLVKSYKAVVQLELGEEFPEDPKAQLWGAVGAVFNSWMNQRAKTYRPLVIVKVCQSESKENSRDHTRSYLDALSHQSEYVKKTISQENRKEYKRCISAYHKDLRTSNKFKNMFGNCFGEGIARYPGVVGHSRERPSHGLRKYGQRLCDWCCLHSRSIHRKE